MRAMTPPRSLLPSRHRHRGGAPAGWAFAALALLAACTPSPTGGRVVEGVVYELAAEGGEFVARPLKGAVVFAHGQPRTQGRTAKDGRFTLSGVPEEGPLILRSEADGFAPAASPLVVPGTARQDLYLIRWEALQRLETTRRDDLNDMVRSPLDLMRGLVLARVVDADTQHPLGGARVGAVGTHALGVVRGRGPKGPDEAPGGAAILDGMEGSRTLRFVARGYEIPDVPVEFVPGVVIAVSVKAKRVVTAAPAAPPAGITFEDATERARLRMRNGFGLGQGVVARDFDGDGHVDLLFTNGAPERHRLMLNDGTGRFLDATAESGLDHPRTGHGACAADVNNDGLPDVYIAAESGHGMLYLNAGGGRFTPYPRVLPNQTLSHGCAFADLDADGTVELLVGGARHEGRNVVGEVLIIRDGGEGFAEAARIVARGGPVLAMTLVDMDRDGLPELITANNFGSIELFRFHGVKDGQLQVFNGSQDVGLLETHQVRRGWMGLATADYDGDGHEDVFVTQAGSLLFPFLGENAGLGRNFLGQWSAGEGRFVRRELPAGVANTGWGWGAEAADFDNDGCADIYTVGNFYFTGFGFSTDSFMWRANFIQVDSIEGGVSGVLTTLFQNSCDGKLAFRDVTRAAGIAIPFDTRGLAVADLNGDGFPDFVVTSFLDPPVLLMNSGNGNNWLGVKVVGTTSNRDGIGARVTVKANGRTQSRYVRAGSSYLSTSDIRVFFGLGLATEVDDVEVTFPSGRVARLGSIAVGQVVEVVEPWPR
jgi:hypothetical protein